MVVRQFYGVGMKRDLPQPPSGNEGLHGVNKKPKKNSWVMVCWEFAFGCFSHGKESKHYLM